MIKRNLERGKRTGRWVPQDAFVLGKTAAQNFDALSKVADETLRFDVRKAPKHVDEVLADLSNLFEAEEQEEPDEPAVKLIEIRRRCLEGLRKEKTRIAALPEKYERTEGVFLAHYDDAHVVPLEDEEEEDDDGDSATDQGSQGAMPI
jgi:hypothetical protein